MCDSEHLCKELQSFQYQELYEYHCSAPGDLLESCDEQH